MAEINRPIRRVRRNLMLEFERVGGSERQRQNADIENEFNELLQTDLNSKSRKWNFDFATGTPREGVWVWFAVSEDAGNRQELERERLIHLVRQTPEDDGRIPE
ncbi:UNVERIFIED_CONTAM: hypothetical protein PYX00_005844 [Menopon gallinae]